FDAYTHLVITSKTAISLLFEFAENYGIAKKTILDKKVIVVGKATAAAAAEYGLSATFPVADETAEGMVTILKGQNLQAAYLFWPHSVLSRSILPEFFQNEGLRYCDAVLYDTIPNCKIHYPQLDLNVIDEIVFTSPSTVDAFCQILGPIPWHKQITSIGPITAAYLENHKLQTPLR
ncbi:MAG: uroporphyrinogen-III synthase, partial [Parachlamydiaceae bacterium]|nr:uroporphyrinogen-III synthase [Parachlamydiaceae bacterium]